MHTSCSALVELDKGKNIIENSSNYCTVDELIVKTTDWIRHKQKQIDTKTLRNVPLSTISFTKILLLVSNETNETIVASGPA